MNSPDALAPSVVTPAPPTSRTVPLVLSAWALAAFALALAEPITPARAPLVPVSIAALTVAQTVVYRRSAALRSWLAALDVRWLVAWHALRLPIGVRFLQLAFDGRLPGPLALRAGYGDVLAGALALVVVLFLTRSPRSSRVRSLALAWNVFALVDIVAVVASVARVIAVDHEAWRLEALTRAPGAVLPFFIVPTVLATHAYLFARLRGKHRAG